MYFALDAADMSEHSFVVYGQKPENKDQSAELL